MTNHLPEGPPPNTNIAIRLSTHGFGEDTNLQPIVLGNILLKVTFFSESSQNEGSSSGGTRVLYKFFQWTRQFPFGLA